MALGQGTKELQTKSQEQGVLGEDGQEERSQRGQAETPQNATPAAATASVAAHHRDGALALLALFQREGRLIDFLREPLDGYEDTDIGAAVRDVHRGCKKVVDDCVHWEALMPGQEDESVTVQVGFDPHEVRLVGDVRGEPPFTGILRHRGLRAAKVNFPTLTAGIDRTVVAPAEVEVS